MVIGYFIENRSSAELARFLGVTESRVSQLRSEAIDMLRSGIAAQYDSGGSVDLGADSGTSRADRRRATFAADLAGSRDSRSRLSARS